MPCGGGRESTRNEFAAHVQFFLSPSLEDIPVHKPIDRVGDAGCPKAATTVVTFHRPWLGRPGGRRRVRHTDSKFLASTLERTPAALLGPKTALQRFFVGG